MSDPQPIPGFNGYWATPDGTIYSSRRGNTLRAMKPSNHSAGYHVVMLTLRKNVSKLQFVHRLVALTFVPNPNSHPEVDHCNGMKTDNSVGNLRWATSAMQKANSERPAGASGHRGVRRLVTRTGKVRWQATYGNSRRDNHTQVHLGTFDTAKEAGAAVREYRQRLHGHGGLR
jgi:hypothetical protein